MQNRNNARAEQTVSNRQRHIFISEKLKTNSEKRRNSYLKQLHNFSPLVFSFSLILSYRAAVDDYYFAVHKTVAVARHKGGKFGEFGWSSRATF
jgi:hypothetical protein